MKYNYQPGQLPVKYYSDTVYVRLMKKNRSE